jgi:hypothetical protein
MNGIVPPSSVRKIVPVHVQGGTAYPLESNVPDPQLATTFLRPGRSNKPNPRALGRPTPSIPMSPSTISSKSRPDRVYRSTRANPLRLPRSHDLSDTVQAIYDLPRQGVEAERYNNTGSKNNGRKEGNHDQNTISNPKAFDIFGPIQQCNDSHHQRAVGCTGFCSSDRTRPARANISRTRSNQRPLPTNPVDPCEMNLSIKAHPHKIARMHRAQWIDSSVCNVSEKAKTSLYGGESATSPKSPSSTAEVLRVQQHDREGRIIASGSRVQHPISPHQRNSNERNVAYIHDGSVR